MTKKKSNTSEKVDQNTVWKTTKSNQTLECILTQEEVREAAKSLAEALNKKNQAELRKESFNQQIKAEIAQEDARISQFQELVSSEKEYRDVECDVVWYLYRNGGEKEIIRKDTGAIIRTDIITEGEKQADLPLQVQ